MPQRTREHIIADLSVNFVERQVLLAGHTIERWYSDYGIDQVISTYDQKNLTWPQSGYSRNAGRPLWICSMNKVVPIKSITFAQLEKILKDLGFRKRVVPSKAVVYNYSPTRTDLIVRVHTPNELVPDYVLVSIRHQLDAQGVIAATEFETLL